MEKKYSGIIYSATQIIHYIKTHRSRAHHFSCHVFHTSSSMNKQFMFLHIFYRLLLNKSSATSQRHVATNIHRHTQSLISNMQILFTYFRAMKKVLKYIHTQSLLVNTHSLATKSSENERHWAKLYLHYKLLIIFPQSRN